MIDEGKSKKDEVRLPVIASPQIEAIHAEQPRQWRFALRSMTKRE
jgi:hypothetical protein